MLCTTIMSHEVQWIPPDATVARAAKLMAFHNLGVLPVCSADGKAIGVITDRDIALRVVGKGRHPAQTKVGDAMTTPVPAALALKLNVPILFASNRRLGGARFQVTMHPPLSFTPSGDQDADVKTLTTAINLKLEEIVRADPGQWLWIHRRWPGARDIITGKRG